MALNGIDAVTFGVADMAEARRFCGDWGLSPVSDAPDRAAFRTRDGGEVILRPHDAPDLPPAIEPGNTVREITWGAADEGALRDTLNQLRGAGALADGGARDPNGLRLSFRVSRRQPMTVEPTPVNAPGAHNRVDRRSPVHDRAEPITIGHVVLFASDFAAMRGFYLDALGLTLSDEYPNHGAFMRCQLRGEHHNVFVLNRPGKPGVNHVAFTVTDVHEVIGGGIAMSKKGWKTEIGPGRHPVSSAYFWYFHNPLGAPVEYYADDDYCTEAWQPQQFVRKPELFAEWAIAGGIDGRTRRQVVALDDSGRGHA